MAEVRNMFAPSYWKDLAERVIASTAGGALAATAGDVPLNVWEADWKLVAGVALGAGVVSLLKGLAARRIGDRESAALRR